MGILTEDDSLVDAALSEILSLPLERRHELDPRRDVDYILVQHHLGQVSELHILIILTSQLLSQGDTTKALAIAQQAIHNEPSLLSPKVTLASLALQQGQHSAALALLKSQNENLANMRESLGLRAVAESMSGEVQEAIRGAQKAIMLTPWEVRNWQTLALVRTQDAE